MVKIKVKRDPANVTGSLTKKLLRLGHIGGGYARFCAGLSLNPFEDIDIYPVHKNAVPAIEKLLLESGCVPDAYPFTYIKDSYKYQIVEKLTFDSPIEILNNMPCSVQEAVFKFSGELLVSDKFMELEPEKVVELNFDIKHQPSIDTYEVIIYKYINKGYSVTKNSYIGLAGFLSQKSADAGGRAEAAIGVSANGLLCGWGLDDTNTNRLHSAIFNLLYKHSPDIVYTTLQPDAYDRCIATRKNIGKIYYGLNNYIKNNKYFSPEIEKVAVPSLQSLPLEDSIITYKSHYSQCEEFWDLSGKYPIAKFAVACPSCKCLKTMPNRYRFHAVEDSPTKYRCVLSYKCHNCSRTWWETGKLEDQPPQWIMYGIVIPEEMYNRVEKSFGLEDGFIPPITWRDIDKIE